MAVQQGYGKMAGANSLVFAYDTGDTVNSYKGAPTTNLISGVANPTLSADGWVEHGWSGSIDVDTQENALVLTATNGWHSIAYDFGSLNSPITVSFKAKLKSKQTTNIPLHVLNGLHLGDYDQWLGSITTPTLTEYQEFVFTFTPTERALICLVLRGADTLGLTDEIYIKDLQVEQKSFKTAFVNGTRSATEGLIDLTGNQVIELADISFDSNGKITFDGITNYIDCGDIVSGRETFSAESWVKTEDVRVGANGSYKNPSIFGTQHGSGASGDFALCVKSGNLGYYAELGSTGYRDSGVFIADNIWHHLAVTKDLDGIIKLYVDGVEVYSRTGNTGTLRTTDLLQYHWEVGRAYWRGEDSTMLRFNGDIATHRFYDRALSASEILANYNNQKTRFNIA